MAAEAANPAAPHSYGRAAVRVCERLRFSLGNVAGPAGFAALLGRALALARTGAPALQAVTVTADGRLQGLEAVANGDGGEAAAGELIAHLLHLLDTFIGQSLTLRLVRNAWPDATFDD